MAQDREAHKKQVLDFFYDDEDSCALTVLVNDVRFHIMVDSKDLRKSSDKNLYYEYLDKLNGLRDAEQREEEETEERQAAGQAKKKTDAADKDSAVDVTADEDSDEDQDSGSAQVELRNWILAAFADVTATWAPPNREPIESSLHEWYHGPTYFYTLQVKSGSLDPELLETTNDLNERIEKLVPRMKVPKYIQSINVPWYNANDLTVQSEVTVPEPAHPGQVVDQDNNVFFFKPVVASQPGPIKREIQILQKLASLEVDIKAPKLLGFVAYENSKTEIIGFLLTPISSPRPLTTLLKTSVAEERRAEWSEKSEIYVKTLHDNGIVWGDAKADNFIVDEHDDLWIIDFGGSFTEGWVDPELSETKEGDEMGLEKVQLALEDPEKNTLDPAASNVDGEVKETASSLFVTERKPTALEEEEEEEEIGGKRKRGDDEGGERKRLRSDGDVDEH